MLLDYQIAKKDYLQINPFLASGARVEKNFEVLLMKATESLGDGAKEKIVSSINENLDGCHSVAVRDWLACTQPAWLSGRQNHLVH